MYLLINLRNDVSECILAQFCWFKAKNVGQQCSLAVVAMYILQKLGEKIVPHGRQVGITHESVDNS